MANNNELFQSEIDNALLNFKNANYHETINILDKEITDYYDQNL